MTWNSQSGGHRKEWKISDVWRKPGDSPKGIAHHECLGDSNCCFHTDSQRGHGLPVESLFHCPIQQLFLMSLGVPCMAFISACSPLTEGPGLQFSFSTLYANLWAPLTLAKVSHSVSPEPFLITALVQWNQMCKLIQIVPSGLQASIAWRIWAII